MRENKVLAVILLVAAASLAILGASWFLERVIGQMGGEYRALERRRAALTEELNRLMDRKRLFSAALESLEQYAVATPSNRLDVYSGLQRAVWDGGVEIRSARWSEASPAREDAGVLTVVLRGGYCDMIRTLALWRGLPLLLRVNELAIRPLSPEIASGAVEAEITLEALLAPQ